MDANTFDQLKFELDLLDADYLEFQVNAYSLIFFIKVIVLFSSNLVLCLIDVQHLLFTTQALLADYQKSNCESFKIEQKCFKQLHHQVYRLDQIEKSSLK